MVIQTSGSYRVWFYDPNGDWARGYFGAGGYTSDPTAAIPLEVPPDVTGVDVTLPPGYSIGGVVSGEAGELIGGIWVTACRRGPTWMTCESTASAVDGTYAVRGLVAGFHSVRFGDPNGVYLSGYYSEGGLKPSEDQATLIEIPPDATDVDVVLPEGAHIIGTVTGPSGTPLSAIHVSATPVDGGGSGGATTRSDGTYRLALWPGSYRLLVYDPSWIYGGGIYATSGLTLSWQEATLITVPPDAIGIDIEMPLGSRISGTVTGSSGEPLSGIQVYPQPGPPVFALATTQIDGTYMVRALLPGSYRLSLYDPSRAYPSGYYSTAGLTPHWQEATQIEVPPDATGIDVEMPLGSRISGTVTGSSGEPLSGIHVSASASGEHGGYGVQTASDGTFLIAPLWPDTYRLSLYDPSRSYPSGYYSTAGLTPHWEEATLIEVPPDASGIDIEMPLGGRISGAVSGPTGEGLGEISVSASGEWSGYGVQTAPDGSFVITALWPGSYRLRVYDPSGTYAGGYYSTAGLTPRWEEATLVTVPPDATGIDIAMPLGSRISGTVTGLSVDPATGIAVVKGVSARVSACLIDAQQCRIAMSGSDGAYSVRGLFSGRYWVRFSDPAGDYQAGYFSDSGYVAYARDATPVVVPPDATSIDATLPVAHRISGAVTNLAGDAISTVSVRVCLVSSTWCQYGWTNTDGLYSVGGLAGGAYLVEFRDWQSQYGAGYYSTGGLTILESQATLVAVPPNATGIDVVLPDASQISGSVTGPAGDPLNTIQVEACPFEGAGLCQTTWTSSSGQYELAGLAPASYRVSFVDTGEMTHASGYYGAAGFVPGPADAVPVVVPPDATGIDVQLPVGSRISGTLTGPGVGPEGNPARWVEVRACSMTGDWCWSGWSDSEGDYTVSGLVPGTYQVSFVDDRDLFASGYYSESSDSGFSADPAAATILEVPPSLTGIDARLPGARHIAGKVTGPGGVPLAGIHVTACPMSGGEFCGHATTAADGTYSAGGLVRGMYEVAFDDPSGTYVGGFYDGTGIISSQSIRLKVSTEDVSGINVQTWLTAHPPTQYVVTASNYRPKIGAPVAVSAQLADAGGQPVAIAGFEVTWTASGTGAELSATSSTTNAEGVATVTFTIRKAPGRAHHVTATDADGRTGTSPNIGRGQKP